MREFLKLIVFTFFHPFLIMLRIFGVDEKVKDWFINIIKRRTKMRTFVISDIHGAHRALTQVIQLSKIDKEKDRLICLGDTCDGWPDIKECFDELMTFKNLIYLRGNHDEWTFNWLMRPADIRNQFTYHDRNWLVQGGVRSVERFAGVKQKETPDPLDIPEFDATKYTDFWMKNTSFYHLEDNRLFVHAGFDHIFPLKAQSNVTFTWDREYVRDCNHKQAMHEKHGHDAQVSHFKEVFVGHTPTLIYNQTEPINNCECWMIDTGASYTGPLTIMNADTKEFWQSDPVVDLYPGLTAR